jgi:DegV family protein with EDD domain
MSEKSYQLFTDSNSETPLELIKKYDIPFVRMDYLIDGEEYFYDLGEHTDYKDFFSKVRNGSMPTTSTYPPSFYEDLFRPYLADGKDILFLAFSSELSAAFGFLSTAAENLREEFPGRTVRIVNTRRISAPMAVVVIEAMERYDAGMELEELALWVEENYKRSHGYFTVDDLNHLKRGGRISPAVAMVGTMMNVKPILAINNDGKIVSLEKAKGCKKALHRIVELTVENVENPEDHVLMILHADCEDEALKLKSMIEEKLKFKDVYLQYVGPVIGTHCGPNTLAACFMGKVYSH